MHSFDLPRLPVAFAVGAALALGGCASLSGSNGASASGPMATKPTGMPTAAAGAASAPAGALAAAPTPPASPLPPFDKVIKDATKTDGLFAVWRKDDKVWLELKEDDFGKQFFLSPKLSRGIGENGIFGGTMFGRWGDFGRPQIVEFQKVQNQVRLLAVNTEFIADPGTPEARAVAAGFSRSLLASTGVSSAPHPALKTVLVDANGLFAGDLQGMGMRLQRIYRQGYSLDSRHSGIDDVRATPDAVNFAVTQHFFTPTIAVPMPPSPGVVLPPGAPVPTTPNGLPDARSMFLGLHYSITKLPATPMAPRLADARVGYFTTNVQNFGSDLARTPRQRYVNRWRLEKKDPTAAISEPVKPITFWLDKTVPVAYRGAMTEGVLEWNKAFERIGFKDAIVVKQQSDDADFDTLDVGVASIRWMINSKPAFGAIGPSQVDPRTGEILDADIGFESLSSRGLRAIKSQILGGGYTMDWGRLMQASDALAEGALPDTAPAAASHTHDAACQHGDFAAEQLGYALDVLEARGDLEPDSPQTRQFVLDYLKDTTMHEVGHTLGLRHNFRSSRIYTDAQMSDEVFTRGKGLAGSVMEYAPLNLPRPGAKQTFAFQTSLGPYDYWAIEYAYKPIPAKGEAVELQRIAGRSAEPELAYGTDEDNGLGIDPETLHFDLGNDPVAFAKKRFEIGRDIIGHQESRVLKPEADYAVLRRSITYAVRDMGRATGILARQIGGVRTLRDHPGTGRDPLQPVPAAVQREALDTLSREVLSAKAFQISPALQRKLAPDFGDRTDALFSGDASVATDFSLESVVSQLRRALLAQLMSDGLATRILESAQKVAPGESFRLSELYSRLTAEIWSELASGKGDIPGPRRELQRDHVNRLAVQVVRPGSSRADTRSLLRLEARGLLDKLEGARKRKGLSAESRAHIADATESLKLALSAKVQRTAP
jgi:hypothetical protein